MCLVYKYYNISAFHNTTTNKTWVRLQCTRRTEWVETDHQRGE